MKFESKTHEDGSLEVTIRLSREQVQALAASAKPSGIEPASEVSTLDWGKSEYCVVCSQSTHRQTIEAYGDIHANIIASSICPNGYGLQSGRCR
jgi:hypothetical protein